jgi:hypothetical protein
MEAAAEKPLAAAGTLGALVLTLLYLILGRRGPAPAESTKDQPEGTKDEAEEDDKVGAPLVHGLWAGSRGV